MHRVRAAVGSVIFLFVAPGVVAVLVPWWLTGWELTRPFASWWPLRVVGVALVVIGAAALLHAFAKFVLEGFGTPAPVAPTENLVVGGLYQYVRNPMYVAVLAVISGQALFFWQIVLLPYAAAVFAAVASFVRWYEEPALTAKFGDAYRAYRRQVPAWWPRIFNRGSGDEL
jgi:protein-S-isoprenylcysteine O-methyltransferase Ste14